MKLLLIVLFCFSLNSWSAFSYEDSLCSYNITGSDTIIDYIDIVEWNGKIKKVPLNISRILVDSLKLCMGNLSLTAPVDIIYIMDLSRSMITTYNPSGDPFKKRDDILRAGFQYQTDSLRESHAGYIGFGSTIPSGHILPPVNVITGQTQLINMADHLSDYIENLQHAGGTNYRVVLDQAIAWLQDTLLCPHPTKAIIFISDGDPNIGDTVTNAQMQFLQNNFTDTVEVHGLFLGQNMGTALQNLATQTGGTFIHVPPLNTDTIETILEIIIPMYIDPITAEKATIINHQTNDTAISIGTYEINDTIWQFQITDFLPLQIGPNQVTVYSNFKSTGGYDTTLDFSFFIEVTGDVPYNSECYDCWHRAELELLADQVAVDTLTAENDTVTIKLEYFGEDSLDRVEVIIATREKQDLETAVFENIGWSGQAWIFSGSVPFIVTVNAAVTGNGIIEADTSDFVYLQWVHPRDLRDTAVDTVTVKSDIVSVLPFRPLNQQKIRISQVTNSLGTSFHIFFSNPIKNIEASFVRLDGRLISNCKKANTRSVVLNTGNMANGMYILRLQSNKEVLLRKVCLTK
jgi:hypothetical protein